jgi:hypothetical protein
MNEYLLFFIGMALMVMAPGPDFMNVGGQLARRNSFIPRKDRCGCSSGYSELSQSSLRVLGSHVLRLPSILPDPEFARTRRFGGFRKRSPVVSWLRWD